MRLKDLPRYDLFMHKNGSKISHLDSGQLYINAADGEIQSSAMLALYDVV